MDTKFVHIPTVSLSLTVKNASKAMDFYQQAFGARELFRMPTPDGGVAHLEFMLGNTHMYMSEEYPDWRAEALSEGTLAPCLFAILVDDCVAAFSQAIAAGGEPIFEPTDQFWGVRNGMIKDPFGYRWTLNEKIEDVSPRELARRAREFNW